MAGRTIVCYAALSLGACAAVCFQQTYAEEPAQSKAEAKIRQEFAAYPSWTKMTEKSIPGAIIAFCAPAGEVKSPHAGRTIRVFVSPNAEKAFAQKNVQQFPEGTVIVKEKLRDPNDSKPYELGVMIKRKQGSSPATHDWQYAFVDSAGKTSLGAQVENCARCHAAAKTDSVFGVGPIAANAGNLPNANRSSARD